MSTATNNVLYWSGTILDDAPDVDSQLQQTGSSGIRTVLLWSLHVTSETANGNTLGDLHWNDTPIVVSQNGQPVFDPQGVFTQLSSRLVTLLGNDTSVYNVFFSVGSGGVNDFTAIQTLLSTAEGTATLTANFKTLLSNLPQITGFDFDDEDNYDVNTVAGFTALLFNNFGSTITYCPYWNFDFWEQCMEQVYQNLQQQPVAWWNLQCYSGGTGNNPVSWASQIASNQAQNGVPNADAFIIPGYAAQNPGGDGPGKCPSFFCKTFANYQGKVPGGFIWNSQHVFDNTILCGGSIPQMADYNNAINNGLSGGGC